MIHKFLASSLLFLGISFWSPAPALAADIVDNFDVFEVFSIDEDQEDEVDGSTTISDNIRDAANALPGENKGNIVMALMLRVINVLLLLIGTFAFLVIFYSGVLLVTANGDEGKLEKGKNMIVPAILGLVFAFLSYYIAVFVQSFFY